MTSIRRVAVLGGNRIPFARSGTAYARASNQQMLTATLQGLIDRFGLHGERLGEVAAGAVMKHSRDFNLVRESVLGTTLSAETPAFDLQQACGTGLEAAILIANKIALGQIESGVAGGVDTTSDAPIALNERLRLALLAVTRQDPAAAASCGSQDAARPVFPALASAQCRAANRALHGRACGADGAPLGDFARGAGSTRVAKPSPAGSGLLGGLFHRSDDAV